MQMKGMPVVRKSKRSRTTPQKNYSKSFAYWSLTVLLFKIIISMNISGGAWYAADGVNYIKGVEALLNEGVFSKEKNLSYWPAGYPLIIYLLSLFGINWLLSTLAIGQSALFSFSIYFFAKQLLDSRIKRYAQIVFFFIILNPTLSLSSLSIGYESFAVSGSLLILGIIQKDLNKKNESKFVKNLVYASVITGILVFIQPRLVVAGVLVLAIWIFIRKPKKLVPIFLSPAIFIVMVFPGALIVRNIEASGVAAVSTNLGTTMNIGAGDFATGGYDSKEHGVECKVITSDLAKADNQMIICVLKWYSENPGKALKLFYNKTVYFWSPWSGPVLSGTMGLNPWLKINPITKISKTAGGAELIGSLFGKIIAYLWIFVGLFLLFYGFSILWRARGVEQIIGTLAFTVVCSSWMVTLISIGDHRFRLPIMGMSLFLQSVGLKTILKGGKAQIVDEPSLRLSPASDPRQISKEG